MSNRQISAIIVDDEKEARDLLADLIRENTDLEVIAKDSNVRDALNTITSHQPDIIFLDIDMPGQDGFDLAREIKELGIETTIIFVTGFNEYAIQAFKYAAFDYLLKPVDIEELQKTIQRYKVDKHKQCLGKNLEKLTEYLAPERIRFNTRAGFIVINPLDIVYCEADGNYTTIHLSSGINEYVTLQIGKIEEALNNHIFARINRSVIINKNHISSFSRVTRQLKLTNVIEQIEFKVARKVVKEL